MRQYILSDELMNNLEEFSAKLVTLSWFANHINKAAWNIREKYQGKESEDLDELSSLTEALSDLAALYEGQLDAIVKKVGGD